MATHTTAINPFDDERGVSISKNGAAFTRGSAVFHKEKRELPKWVGRTSRSYAGDRLTLAGATERALQTQRWQPSLMSDSSPHFPWMERGPM